MPERVEIAAVLVAIVAIGSVAAIAFGLAISHRWPTLPTQRRRAVAWDGWICLWAFLLFALTSELIAAYLSWIGAFAADDGDASRVFRACLAKIIALPIQLEVGMIGLFVLGIPLYQLRFGSLRRAVALGVPTWVVVATATYLVNLLAFMTYRLVTGKPPEEHPLLQALQVRGAGALTVLVLFESCVGAPLREEVLFRGLLLPWLTKHDAGALIGIALAAFAAIMLGGTKGTLPGTMFAVALVPIALALDRWSTKGLTGLIPIHNAEARRRAFGAMVGSAALFANFHANVWPTPVALFVFGLGVGWLAIRTQSLGPPLVVHMLFNAVAIASILFR